MTTKIECGSDDRELVACGRLAFQHLDAIGRLAHPFAYQLDARFIGVDQLLERARVGVGRGGAVGSFNVGV